MSLNSVKYSRDHILHRSQKYSDLFPKQPKVVIYSRDTSICITDIQAVLLLKFIGFI